MIDSKQNLVIIVLIETRSIETYGETNGTEVIY